MAQLESTAAVNDDPTPDGGCTEQTPHSLAEKLYKAKFVHAIYGALDGLSISYSTLKYCFDIYLQGSSTQSSDIIHDKITTLEGAIGTAIEAVCFMAFSLLANIFNQKDKNAFKRFIAVSWPYFRDVFKGAKNAYRGVRSTLFMVGHLAGQSMGFLILPIGLAMGALAVINRLWYRSMKDQRKEMMEENSVFFEGLTVIKPWCQREKCVFLQVNKSPEQGSLKTFLENYKIESTAYVLCDNDIYYIDKLTNSIHKLKVNEDDIHKLKQQDWVKSLQDDVPFDLENLDDLEEGETYNKVADMLGYNPEHVRKRLDIQQNFLNNNRWKGVLCQAYSGIVDGVYLFMGPLGLSALVPPVFLAMSVLCILYVGVCIATRIYEEKSYQQNLAVSNLKVKLALLSNDLQIKYNLVTKHKSMCDSNQLDSMEKELAEQFQTERANFATLFQDFLSTKGKIKELEEKSTLSVFLDGMKNGLAAHSALSTSLFVVAAVCAITSTAFPPALLITMIAAGAVLLISFTAYAFYHQYKQQKAKKSKKEKKEEHIPSQKEKLLTKWEQYFLDYKNDILKDTIYDEFERGGKHRLENGARAWVFLDPSPQFFFQEWFEVLRSFFSGLKKAQSSVDYTCAPLQVPDETGHYHDSSVMFILSAVLAGVTSFIFALRAYARGFGRNKKQILEPLFVEEKDSLEQDGPNSQEEIYTLSEYDESFHDSSDYFMETVSAPLSPAPDRAPNHTPPPSAVSDNPLSTRRYRFWSSTREDLASALRVNFSSDVSTGCRRLT